MNKAKNEIYTFSSDPELMKVLVSYANEKDLSKSQVIRRAIRQMLEKEGIK